MNKLISFFSFMATNKISKKKINKLMIGGQSNLISLSKKIIFFRIFFILFNIRLILCGIRNIRVFNMVKKNYYEVFHIKKKTNLSGKKLRLFALDSNNKCKTYETNISRNRSCQINYNTDNQQAITVGGDTIQFYHSTEDNGTAYIANDNNSPNNIIYGMEIIC